MAETAVMNNMVNKQKSDVTQERMSTQIILVPQPTSDPLDPLVQPLQPSSLAVEMYWSQILGQNWPQRKKYTTLAILCLAAFAGTASSLVNQLAFEVQGRLYHKTLAEMSYSVSLFLLVWSMWQWPSQMTDRFCVDLCCGSWSHFWPALLCTSHENHW